MPATWKSVRVFISSTFRDMHAERDHLVKVTFPALRERLEKYRIYLDDIDLRWGVTREQAENDQVLDLCLQQIDECRPFFIGILGERYGWVPTRYPADALRKFGWIQHHTGKSVTELEILHGVLENGQMRGRAFFYFRDPVAIQSVPESIRRAVYAETDRGQIEKLLELKSEIRHSGYPVMEHYPARWDPEAYDRPSRSKGRLVDLDEFGQRVHDQLWQAIQEEFQLPEQPPVFSAADPLAEEQDYHERFMESRLRVYVGREQINEALLAFADGRDLIPCLVTGPSGSGKSAVLARIVRDYRHQRPQTLVIPHFIGASPRSTNLRDMLRRFCQVFKARFGFAEDVPEEVAKLSVAFREFVGKVPAETRVLLVIDALNQLDEADRAQDLYWLPTELPPQVKVIVSCISDSGRTEPVLEAFRRRKYHPVELAALTDTEQRLIIRQVPSLSAKTLDDDQVRLLLSNPATVNPLFLLVALEELRGFASFERLNERIAALPREGDTVTAIFTQVIERLAEEFDQKLVETVLTLLASARRGLSERELQELVAGLDSADDPFPVLRQLRPYLLSRAGLIDFYHRNLFKAVRERYLPSEEQQRQAHVRLAEYFNAQDYWLESLEEQRARAKRLPPTPRPANVRKVDELPWLLLQATDWLRCEQLLTDLTFLEAKAEAGMVFDLAADFSAVIGDMPGDRSLLRILQLLEEALRRDIHFIARHPTTLFQCFWNVCWWYDGPEVVNHYDLPCGGWVGGLPSKREGVKLRTCLEHWHRQKVNATPGFVWVRSLRAPEVPLGFSGLPVLHGHDSLVHSVAFSPDGRWIASASEDATVRIWDFVTGESSRVLSHHEAVNAVAFSPTGRWIISGSGDHYKARDNSVRIWDSATGALVTTLHGHATPVNSVAVSSDERLIASAAGSSGDVPRDTAILIWDLRTKSIVARCEGHQNRVESVAFSPIGSLLASGSIDETVRIWDVERSRVIAQKTGKSASEVSFSPDGSSVVFSSQDGSVTWWDWRKNTAQVMSHDLFATCVAVSPDGTRIASGSYDRTIRIWEATTSRLIAILRGHEQVLLCVAFSPNGEVLVSGGGHRDHSVRLWNMKVQGNPPRLRGHKGILRNVIASPDSRSVATSSTGSGFGGESNDNSIRIWDTTSGLQIAVLRNGHEWWIRRIAFSAKGWLASGSENPTIRIWDPITRKTLQQIEGMTSAHCLAISPDSTQIVTAFNRLTLWDVETGKIIRELAGHPEGVVNALCFSPDGAFIASGSGSDDGINGVSHSTDDSTIRVWNVSTGVQTLVIEGHKDSVRSVAISPEGSRLLSGSWDRTVRLWETRTGRLLHILSGHEGRVERVAFSADGKWILSQSEYEFIIWDSESLIPVEHIHSLGGETVLQVRNGSPALFYAQPLRNLQRVAANGRLIIGSAGYHLILLSCEGEYHSIRI